MNNNVQDQALAGFTAGLISTTILHPLDVIKIRFQGNINIYSTFINYNNGSNNNNKEEKGRIKQRK